MMSPRLTSYRLVASAALSVPLVVAGFGSIRLDGAAREIYEPGLLQLGVTNVWLIAVVVAGVAVVGTATSGWSTRTLAASTKPKRFVGERGGVTPFVLLFVIPMAMMAALAFDGGQILTERRAALDVAQNAALAGVQAVDGASIRQGGTDIDVGAAQAAAQNYLGSQGYAGSVSVSEDTVTVIVIKVVDMQLLGAVGVDSKTVTGVGRARIVRGVQGAET